MAERLHITINYLSLLENHHKPVTKKVKERLKIIMEKSNTPALAVNEALANYTTNSTRNRLAEVKARKPDPKFIEVIKRPPGELSQVENCARDIWSAYHLCRAIGLECQFLTLISEIKQAIERPEDSPPADNAKLILDQIRHHAYPQYKEQSCKK